MNKKNKKVSNSDITFSFNETGGPNPLLSKDKLFRQNYWEKKGKLNYDLMGKIQRVDDIKNLQMKPTA
jgi:hypothetical protein